MTCQAEIQSVGGLEKMIGRRIDLQRICIRILIAIVVLHRGVHDMAIGTNHSISVMITGRKWRSIEKDAGSLIFGTGSMWRGSAVRETIGISKRRHQ
jgi:hypothetical protein